MFSDLDVGACIFYKNVPIETFNISFESTQNKQQYGTNLTCTEVRLEEKNMENKNYILKIGGGGGGGGGGPDTEFHFAKNRSVLVVITKHC